MDQVTKDQYVIEKNGNKYEVVIGLEVHAQVLSDSNYFLPQQQNLDLNPIHRLV